MGDLKYDTAGKEERRFKDSYPFWLKQKGQKQWGGEPKKYNKLPWDGDEFSVRPFEFEVFMRHSLEP